MYTKNKRNLKFNVECPFEEYGCNARPINQQSLDSHLQQAMPEHLKLLGQNLLDLQNMVNNLETQQKVSLANSSTEVAAIDLRVKELLGGAREQVDRMVEKSSRMETKLLQLENRLEALEEATLKKTVRKTTYTNLADDTRMMEIEKLVKDLQNVTDFRLKNLEESINVANRMITSLNRLGFNFECFDISRKISWVVEMQGLLTPVPRLGSSVTCFQDEPLFNDALFLKSPVVTIPCDKVGNYDCYLSLNSNDVGYLFMQVYVIGPKYPVFLEGSILKILGIKALRFATTQVVIDRQNPCEIILFSYSEARKKLSSPYLDIQLEIRATIDDPSMTISSHHTLPETSEKMAINLRGAGMHDEGKDRRRASNYNARKVVADEVCSEDWL